jgi:sulfide:quinone oxidoreductase
MTEHIAIVGGGTDGSVLANDLAERLDTEIDAGEVRVTLINDGPDQVHKPIWLSVPFGLREPEDGRRALSELIDDRVDVMIDRVTAINTDSARLSVRDGDDPVEYDQLVLATGSTLRPTEIAGLPDGGYDYYSETGTEELREKLLSFTEGHLLSSVIETPHTCPAAPLELVLITDAWLRERGLRDDIEFEGLQDHVVCFRQEVTDINARW